MYFRYILAVQTEFQLLLLAVATDFTETVIFQVLVEPG